MMQRRKVQRAFTGLVGLPPEPEEAVVVPAPTPISAEPVAPVKRGRPPKGDRPMTAAERKKAQREREEREDTAPERDNLITLIVRRIKTSEHASIEMMRRALDTFHDSLNELTVEHLRALAKTYNIHDTKGRSSLEGHTGSKLVAGEFIDRIERIHSKSESKELYGGRKPAMGASPNVDDTSDDDSGITSSRLPYEESEVTIWDLLPEISEMMFEGNEVVNALWDTDESTLIHQPTLRCYACGHMASTWVQARRHTEEALKAADKQANYIRDLKALAEKTGDNVLLIAARGHYLDGKLWHHHSPAHRFLKEFRDRVKKTRKRVLSC
jgi:hypothetical protein